ncbi:hypothetical protein BBD42_04830 [Paenibacillus sp. BIHB 4019]|uniref:Uncharacterized protein n=1 Tax=Paenibacillus sp. BIHB 4019 TaxID=1870819 RepID=A0A1B2DDU1_9BACL|nr:hypothetical protein [Paenibacillus sp. BIHB 4019]ANY65866.1 hypothetical protein BBD42_04830 [Paenibacillus sp. BIHB 4019]
MTTRVKYSEIEGQLQTGDILLCHSVLHESLLIEFVQGSPWSHIGMIVRLPQYDFPLLWESTTFDNIPDVLLGKTKNGPMLVPLHERLRTDVDNIWDPMFAFRKLNVQRTPQMQAALLDVIQELHHASFPNEEQMLRIVVDGKLGIAGGNNSLFCSQLLAETFIRMGLLPPHRVPNSYWPVDFSTQGHVELLDNAGFSEELYLLADGLQGNAQNQAL